MVGKLLVLLRACLWRLSLCQNHEGKEEKSIRGSARNSMSGLCLLTI